MGTLRTSQVRAYVYPFDEERPIDVSKYLVNMRVSRKTDVGGAWSLALVPEFPFISILQLGSWVRIEAQTGPAMRFRTLVWGRIDIVSRKVASTGAGARKRIHAISGRDHSGVFLDYAVYFNPFLSMRTEQLGVITPAAPLLSRDFVDGMELAAAEGLGGNPASYVKFIYTVFLERGVSSIQRFSLPTSAGPDILRTGAVLTDNQYTELVDFIYGPQATALSLPGMKGIFFDDSILSTSDGGRLWDLIRQYSNPSFNEFFFTINKATGRPEIQFRERPFPAYALRPSPLETDSIAAAIRSVRNRARGSREIYIASQQWEDILGVAVSGRDLSAISVSRDEQARYNYWMLFADGTPLLHQDQVFMMGDGYDDGAPILDLDSIQRYGLKRFEATTYYTGYHADATAEIWIIPASYWLAQLYSWYSLGPSFLKGTASLPYLERAEVGERFWVKEDDGGFTEYYINGVTWQWSKGAQGESKASTNLTISRGITGINGTVHRGEHHDLLEWDVSNNYPLPMPPPRDVKTLLEAAALDHRTWNDPSQFDRESSNIDFESGWEINRQPLEYQTSDASLVSTLVDMWSARAENCPPRYSTRETLNDNMFGTAYVAYFEGDGGALGTGDEDAEGYFYHADDELSEATLIDTSHEAEEQTQLTYVDLDILGFLGSSSFGGDNPIAVVLHSTATTTYGRGRGTRRFNTFMRNHEYDEALTAIANLFTNNWISHEVPLSLTTHFLISLEGFIVQFLPLNKEAWSAGSAANDLAIAIDLEGKPRDHTKAQKESLRLLLESSELRRMAIFPHRSIPPTTHTDPDGHVESDWGWGTPPYHMVAVPAEPSAGPPRVPLGMEVGGHVDSWEGDVQRISAELLAYTGPRNLSGPISSLVGNAAHINAAEGWSLDGVSLYTDRTSSFVGSQQVLYGIPVGLDMVDTGVYQNLLWENGVEIADVADLTYLRDPRKVQELAEAGVEPFWYDSDDERTMFAIPPPSYYPNILPALLLLQAAWSGPAERGGLGRPLSTFREYFEFTGAYRPPAYNQATGVNPNPSVTLSPAGPDADGSMYRFNHALSFRLKMTPTVYGSGSISDSIWGEVDERVRESDVVSFVSSIDQETASIHRDEDTVLDGPAARDQVDVAEDSDDLLTLEALETATGSDDFLSESLGLPEGFISETLYQTMATALQSRVTFSSAADHPLQVSTLGTDLWYALEAVRSTVLDADGELVTRSITSVDEEGVETTRDVVIHPKVRKLYNAYLKFHEQHVDDGDDSFDEYGTFLPRVIYLTHIDAGFSSDLDPNEDQVVPSPSPDGVVRESTLHIRANSSIARDL